MAKIKITDLPKDTQISREEMKKVFGGAPRTVTIWQPVRGGISTTPVAIDRNVMPGELVGCAECCSNSGNCNCDCEDCRTTGAIRTR
jgi:hypothetical protein